MIHNRLAMVRLPFVCLCFRALCTLPVAFGNDIRISTDKNSTFETTSVMEYLEESKTAFSSVLCKHVSLWFCIVHPSNPPVSHFHTDSDTGISLSVHRKEIDHHVLNPMAPAPWSFTSWASYPPSFAVETRSDTGSYGWSPDVTLRVWQNATTRTVNYFYHLLFFSQISAPPRYHTYPRPVHKTDKYFDLRRILAFDSSANHDTQDGPVLPSDDTLSEVIRGPVRSPHFLELSGHSNLDSRRLGSIFPYPIGKSKKSTYRFRWTPWDHLFYAKSTSISPTKTTTSTSSKEVAYPSWIANFHAFALHLWSPIKAFFAWFQRTQAAPVKTVLWKIYEAGRDHCGGFCHTLEFIFAWGPMLLYVLWLLPTAFLWLFLVRFWNSYCFAFGKAMWQLFLFAAGKRDWADVRRATGEKIFRPGWTGPGGHTPFSHDYITNDVKGRGKNQLPKDLLISVVIDGYEEIARLRHSGLKTSKPSARGFTAKCDSVISCSNYVTASTQRVSSYISVLLPLAS